MATNGEYTEVAATARRRIYRNTAENREKGASYRAKEETKERVRKHRGTQKYRDAENRRKRIRRATLKNIPEDVMKKATLEALVQNQELTTSFHEDTEPVQQGQWELEL
jgi:geranylgeranyl pyrophosphate synthase